MDITIYPRKLSGTICAIPSKSQAHRVLICSAFSDDPVTIICPETNDDIEATAGWLRALGAQISRTKDGYTVHPIKKIPPCATLDCRESGSTLRFMLPICASIGVNTTFLMSGRLSQRPLSPLWEELERMGAKLSRPTKDTIQCQGRLQSGTYTMDGSISSQFITGLMFALALLPQQSQLTITAQIESKPYIDMTENVLEAFGITSDNNCFGSQFHSPGCFTIEGDWSNAAFFLAAKALGNPVTVSGLSLHSKQGDKAIYSLLESLCAPLSVCCKDIPDLVPILAVAAGASNGGTFYNIGRLRLKESDRVAAVAEMLTTLGSKVTVDGDTMSVSPAAYAGGIIDAKNDHRIAMAAAIASTVSGAPITILGAECVKKSYPDFWSEFTRLGGYYEQYIR